MKIAFQTNQITVRGDAVAVYDYAHFNETLLNNESIILTKRNHTFPHEQVALDKFHNRFNMIFYDSWREEGERILKENNVDILYAIKGPPCEVESKNIKTCIHGMFTLSETQGHTFAYISEYLTKGNNHSYVPHMVNLDTSIKDDFRDALGIPKDATVIGRHGGATTFNIPFATDAVNHMVDKRPDIYFLFLNTNPVCEFDTSKIIKKHDRIIHIPATSNASTKIRFINACDVMLHARINGESFGLAVAEFSYLNKPVMTWDGRGIYTGTPFDWCHIDILGEKGIYYRNFNDLVNILDNFKYEDKNWNAYSDYNPQNVMNKFKEVFIND